MKIIFNSDLYAYQHNNIKYIKEYLIENEIDPTPCAIEDAAIELLNSDYYNFMQVLNEYDIKKDYEYILICGSLGLWNGKKNIIPVKIKDLKAAVLKCCNYDCFMAYYTNIKSTLNIDCHHHDGCNSFKLYAIKNGKKYAIKLNDLF